ncbi:MAG: hypothetical protein LCH67_00965 [Bacteroidetes bacterium]|nr:hypothetical protein [Bacteroidota bacterium]
MENQRPTFLTVLCILTFIGSAWGIFGAYTNYSSAGFASGMGQDVIDQAKDQIESSAKSEKESEFAGKILDSVSSNLTEKNIKDAAIASGISSILTLIGAVLMWGLNKKGYWLYIIGIAVAIIAPMTIYDGIMSAAAGIGFGFFGAIFAVLYGLNLKHMH